MFERVYTVEKLGDRFPNVHCELEIDQNPSKQSLVISIRKPRIRNRFQRELVKNSSKDFPRTAGSVNKKKIDPDALSRDQPTPGVLAPNSIDAEGTRMIRT